MREGAAQGPVTAHFDANVPYWDGIYRHGSLQDRIYQQRQAVVLECVDALSLPPGAPVLEVGCGAGHLSVSLAERGFRVRAIDASSGMVQATAARASDAGVGEMVSVAVADAHALPFESDSFELVVAVGVMPWVHSEADAIAEMARVLRPGGHLILTADNKARLGSWLDPRGLLSLTPLRHVKVALRRRRGLATSHLHFPREIDRMLGARGLELEVRRTVGFGPFSLLGMSPLEEPRAIRVNDRLQALADRGVPGLRRTGWHYVVRASKRRVPRGT